MRTKVTGITDTASALKLIEAGVDVLVFDFSKETCPEVYRDISTKLPPLVMKSGLFTNSPKYEVEELATFCKLDLLEFKGEQFNNNYRGFSQPVIKIIDSHNHLMKNWAESHVAMLQLPLSLYKSAEISFQPVIVDLGQGLNFSQITLRKPYALNFIHDGSEEHLQFLCSLIRQANASF
ncbi:hypothetical protein [Zhaonella formicivorans]|jgi:phosphoribosylanthranilate isomerase|uniref:hypothetical protein n=1 Tax=Zhaonella formicivorans TaxID=2528593 RepID=UPI0010E8EC15|nr:hypothetical protein [Zhaonella formicivorans]